MTTKSELLFASINDFYSDPTHRETLINVLNKKNGSPSLRSIEWFITNYAKKNLTNYPKDGKIFTVHCAYKSTLNGFSKRSSILSVVPRRFPTGYRGRTWRFRRPSRS